MVRVSDCHGIHTIRLAGSRSVKSKKSKAIWVAAVVAAIALAAVVVHTRQQKLDVRFNGAYVLDDGTLVVVIAREGRTLRYRTLDGESRALWPNGRYSYSAGPGWAEQSPVELRVKFELDAQGRPTSVDWEQEGRGRQRARRVDLAETPFFFRSGGLSLRGLLVAPPGPGPFPIVIIAQGSEDDSAIDTYYEPYLFAANGIATLVYDKRGTGQSEGTYTENFTLLAQDLVAAAAWVRTRKEIDASQIHLAGYSQGGWIAPLAAAQDGHIRSLLINYGPAVPVIDEDRWGYVWSLQQQGFGPAEIQKVDQINKHVAAIIDRHENDWSALKTDLDAAKKEPWFNALKTSNSALGYILRSPYPFWVTRVYAGWLLNRDHSGPFIDRLYDPVRTVASLRSTPSLWLFGGNDHSVPTEWSVEKLKALKEQGCPIFIKIYPGADHGILRVQHNKDGEEKIIRIEPGYLSDQVEWLRHEAGLH